jgi:beta-mannosidase
MEICCLKNQCLSEIFFKNKISKLISGKKKEDVYLHVELLADGNVLAENYFVIVPHKSLSLPIPKVEVNISKSGDIYTAKVKTDKFAKNVYVYFEDFDANLSDNFFDLDSNSEKTVTFKSTENISVDDLNKKMKILTLAHTY